MIGIGIVSWNRLPILQECVRAVFRYTLDTAGIVIADDGSTDGTVEWCRSQRLCVIPRTYGERSIARNKNRALWTLLNYTNADVLLLLEDDSHPCELGWESLWVAAAHKHRHINYCHPGVMAHVYAGSGTPDDPYQANHLAGCAIASTREVLRTVGYFDSRFGAYGSEHIDYTRRFGRIGVWAADANACITGGLRAIDCPSSGDEESMEYNRYIMNAVRQHSTWRDPWVNEVERAAFLQEIDRGLNNGQTWQERYAHLLR